jgi:hypothetical protein
VVVYGSPYDDKNVEFTDELHSIMSSWQDPILVGGDFNLSRFISDKSNGRINQKFAN